MNGLFQYSSATSGVKGPKISSGHAMNNCKALPDQLTLGKRTIVAICVVQARASMNVDLITFGSVKSIPTSTLDGILVFIQPLYLYRVLLGSLLSCRSCLRPAKSSCLPFTGH